MLESMPQRGVDDVGVTRAGRALVAHRVRWTTDDARRERQPLRSTDGRVRLVYDGRVDNRDEIAAHLQVPRDATDGQLLVELIAADGPDALARCVGEFALAWWRDDGRALGLARDSLGMRPLYYAVTPRGLLWASELQALFVPGWVTRRVNERFLAEFLTTFPHALDETPFADVYRLPQAHLLEVVNARVVTRKYWSTRVLEERRVADGQAAEEFRAHLAVAVGACVRASKPVAFQLSGGLDSSSVVAMARAGGMHQPAAFSLLCPGDAAADESAYARDVAQFTGARWFPIAPAADEGNPFDYILAHESLPYHAASEPFMRPLVRGAAAEGHDVMLTGLGADQWLTPSHSRIAALVASGRLWDAARFLRDLRATRGAAGDWSWLWGAGILLLVPERIKAVGRRAAGRRDGAAWIRGEFARRTGLDERLRASFRRAPRVRDLVVRESLVRLTGGEEATIREDAERMGTHAGVELRHPYYDRRLVEFVLGLPDDLRYRHGQMKYILRLALQDVLPRAVVDRVGKADFTAASFAIVRTACGHTDWRNLRSADRGWVDADVVQKLTREFEACRTCSPACAAAAAGLWCVAALEAWLRRAFP